MAVWADNIKFVREIIESKFSKIDNSVAEVRRERGSGEEYNLDLL